MTQRTMSFTRLAREGQDLTEPVLVTMAGRICGRYTPVDYEEPAWGPTQTTAYPTQGASGGMTTVSVPLPGQTAGSLPFGATVIDPVATPLRDRMAREVEQPDADHFNTRPFTPAPRTRSGR